MIYAGSIIFIEPENFEDAKKVIAEYSELEIHIVSDDKAQIVVSVETESDQTLDELSSKLKSYDCIIDIGHHIMHFEDEVKDILAGKKIPSLDGFHRSKRREKNPLDSTEA